MGLFDQIASWVGKTGSCRECCVLVLGLDHSGKGKLMKTLNTKREGQSDGENTLYNAPLSSGGSVPLRVLCTRGDRVGRSLWERYYPRADAIVFVVDGQDALRLVVARDEISQVVSHESIRGRAIPLLVLAHPVSEEVGVASSPLTLAKALSMERITSSPWRVCCVDINQEQNLHEGLGWLAGVLMQRSATKKK